MRKCFRYGVAFAAFAAVLVGSANAFSFTYTWQQTDDQMADRLFRDGVPSVYGTPKAFPGTFTGPVFVKTFLVSNPYNTISDLEVTNTTDSSVFNVFLSAYAGSFDPNNLALNYLGDTGSSPDPLNPQTMGIQIAPNTDVILMASSLNLTDNIGTSFTIEGTLTPVPEPASMLAIGAGLAALAARKRRKS